MSFIIPFSYHLADTIAFLILCSVGLAIVFGMMGVINIAHGEFIMLGAYVTTIASRWGVPLPVAILLAILVTGLAGVLLERLVIRHLYGRLFDSIVATWAISLIAMQGMLILTGPSMTSVGTPLGDFSAAGYTFSTYRLVLIFTAVALLGLVYLVFMHTRFWGLCTCHHPATGHSPSPWSERQRHLCRHVRLRRGFGGSRGCALRTHHVHSSDHGLGLHRTSLCDSRGWRWRSPRRHRAGGSCPGPHPNSVDSTVWHVGWSDRLAPDGYRGHPRLAFRHFRVA